MHSDIMFPNTVPWLSSIDMYGIPSPLFLPSLLSMNALPKVSDLPYHRNNQSRLDELPPTNHVASFVNIQSVPDR